MRDGPGEREGVCVCVCERERGRERNNEHHQDAPLRLREGRCYNRCGQTFTVRSRCSIQPFICCINTLVPSLPPPSHLYASAVLCNFLLYLAINLHLSFPPSLFPVSPLLQSDTPPIYHLKSLSLILLLFSCSLSLSAVSHSDLHIFSSN